MPCSSGCKTNNHQTFGECLRAKNIQLEHVEAHAFNVAQRSAADEYVKARYDGLQPDGVSKEQVLHARRMTDQFDRPYRADRPMNGLVDT